MGAISITDPSVFQDTLQTSEWVIVDFWATWCGPCQSMTPVFNDLAENFSSKVTAVKADVDQLKQQAIDYGVRGVPTFMVFHKGQPVDSLVGAHPKQQLANWLNRHIS